MSTLYVKHVAGTGSDDAPRFLVARPDGKATPHPVAIPSPVGYAVTGRPQSDLIRELRWYLETFLDYPFPPNTDRAANILEALRTWGREAFTALFASREALQLFDSATGDGYHNLQLQVWSDDPGILGWPWEALSDPQTGFLAQTSAFERRLNSVRDPYPLAADLPRDRINILLVTARPYERDVRYRSISRPLVELIAKQHLAAHVHVLRPPTLARLREHLRERPGFYHVLHFDGHGSYGAQPAGGSPGAHLFTGPEGRLVFEGNDGKPDPITAETLSLLLREHAVPAVVLNACQSAMVDGRADDPFASVAAALLRSGVRSVVAMAYSLYVSAAQEFLPAYYRRLFESGSAAEAVRAGRQRLLEQKQRVCARGKFDLHDWLVPVLYEQDPLDLSFAKGAKRQDSGESNLAIPAEARDTDNPHGFIGRDGDLLAIERALRGKPAAILIHGLGGVGKTTLARGLVAWLAATEGLGRGCLWLSFQEIRSAEFVLNRLGEELFGGQFAAIPTLEQKIELLAETLQKNRLIIVWDNFEVVAGIAGSAATLSSDDRGYLLALLKKLRGGETRVIITSRSDEDWLGGERRKIDLGGLDGEERWVYVAGILDDLGIAVNRQDDALSQLVELLGGHPLAMRAILPALDRMSATAVAAALRNNLLALGATDGDDAQAKLFATLRFVEQSLPAEQRPLLVALGLHERFVDADSLEHMAKGAPGDWMRSQIDAFCGALAAAGLLHDRGQAIYEMHPALTGYLRATVLASGAASDVENWTRAFVGFMAAVADQLAPKELHEQRSPFHIHGASFYHALEQAQRLAMVVEESALAQSLAAYAQNIRAFREAHDLFARRAALEQQRGSSEGEAGAYHQLGMIAEEQRDFVAAEQWYRKSLAIEEKQGNEHGAASTYHQLGMIAEEQRDFVAAEQWYRKSLAIEEKQDNEHGAAGSYHQLGMIAQKQRDFVAAEQWYRKSLAIKEKQGNEHGAAISYHQLGMIAEEQRDFVAAEQWYRKSLAIFEKQGNEHGAASSYHQLGMIAEEQRDFVAAEQWYRKSLAIEEKQGNEHGAAISYHQLGIIAQEQRDFVAAEQWYRKSLAIFEKQGNEHGAAISYHQLGMIAEEQRDFVAAEQWYRKSLAIKEKQGNEHGAAISYHQLGRIAEEQRDFVAAEQWYRKSLAIKEKQGNEHGAAQTYGQLGNIALEQRDFVAAEQWYRKSLAIKEKQGNEHGAASSYHQLGIIAEEQRDFVAAEQWYRKSLAIKEKQGNEHGAASSYHQLGRIAQEQRDFVAAEQWYRKSLAIFEKQGNEHGAAISYHQLGIIAEEQRDFVAAEQWYRKSLAIFEKQGNEHGAASSYHQLGRIAEEQRDFDRAAQSYLRAIHGLNKARDGHNAAIATKSYLRLYAAAPDDVQTKLKDLWAAAGLGDVSALL